MSRSFTLFIICIFSLSQSHAQKTYNEVTLPELLNKLEQGEPDMIVVDVRSKAEYYDTGSIYQQSNIGRIKGAISLPLMDLRKNPALIHNLDVYKDKNIYLVCSHSYRSRVVSNMLLDSGFTHVNNIRGGMTEFYRRYNEAPRNNFYETSISYKNIAPAQLFSQLGSNKNPLLISIDNTPGHYWDSANIVFNKYFPSFKNALNYNYADSLQILQRVKNENRSIVLFNSTNYGAAELANWLTERGVSDVSYLVGNVTLFYEYLVNENLVSGANKFIKKNSAINFITPSYYCDNVAGSTNTKIIDLRSDTIFNKIINGAKYSYRHLKNAINYFAGNGMAGFEKQFPDKKTGYLFISENGIDGLELAGALTKKGYKINWIIGGMQRWEWYMNNVETFKCMDYLITQ